MYDLAGAPGAHLPLQERRHLLLVEVGELGRLQEDLLEELRAARLEERVAHALADRRHGLLDLGSK